MPPFSFRPFYASFGLFHDMRHSYLFGSDGYASPCRFCSFPSLPSLVTYSDKGFIGSRIAAQHKKHDLQALHPVCATPEQNGRAEHGFGVLAEGASWSDWPVLTIPLFFLNFCMPPFHSGLYALFGLFRDMYHSYFLRSSGYAFPAGFARSHRSLAWSLTVNLLQFHKIKQI